MSRRIDIELTSALGDGTWTWRAAGARQPKGVLDGSILPAGASVGDELKVEIEQEIDGITVLGIVQGRAKAERDDVIELLPVEREFQPVVETRARRERGERRPRRDADRRPRRDGERRDGERGQRGERGERGDRGDRGGRGDGGRPRRGEGGRRGPSFTPPPEVPMRPKPKRLRPGKTHRTAVLADLPEEQRPIAELALQGLNAVRQRVREENSKAAAEGRPQMPEPTVMKMAEELLPKLRVAEWRDRAEAAQRQLEHLDLRDLRSVVAAAGDPMVARDESTRQLSEELTAALSTKQEQELLLWFGDIDAALAVGRVIRALRLSSQPPKAGVPFPVDIAQRLADSTNASLAPMDSPERWSATLEAAAFSPVRSMIQPVRKPDVVNDELLATVTRLAPAMPQVAALFDIEVAAGAPMPKPLRPDPRQRRQDAKGGTGGESRKGGLGAKGRRGQTAATAEPAAASGRDTATAKTEQPSAPESAPSLEPEPEQPAAAGAAEPATESPTAPEATTEAAPDSETNVETETRPYTEASTEPSREPAADAGNAADDGTESVATTDPAAGTVTGPEGAAAAAPEADGVPEEGAEPTAPPDSETGAGTEAAPATEATAEAGSAPEEGAEPAAATATELDGAATEVVPDGATSADAVADRETDPS